MPRTFVSGASFLVLAPAMGPCDARSVRARAVTALASLLLMSACSRGEESNLAKLADKQDQVEQDAGTATPVPSPVEGSSDGTSQPDDAKPSGGPWPVDANAVPIPPKDGTAVLVTPGADSDRIQLRLALPDGARYRIMTLGMLMLPLIDKPTGFAREEDIELGDCTGEAAARSCVLTHRYRNYEAEPPTGKGLEADERQVAGLVTSHRIDASGLRTTDTKIEGEASPAITEQLARVHRLFCIRLPSEPVGVGATWRDVCRMRQGGMLVTRELTWRLAKVERSDDGTRAELEYAGRAWRQDLQGKLVDGEVEGVLYLWADAGEPHLMRERVSFTLDAAKGITSGTDFRWQFAKLGVGDEELLRTDGKPFEQPPHALNDPRSVPAGATRDDELR